MPITLIEVMVLQVFAHVHTHQIVIKYVQFVYINYTSIKLWKKEIINIC